jgi:hypothetical protein
MPKILKDWQGEDIRTDNVKGYYKNPWRESGGEILTNMINKLLSELSPGYNVDPTTNKKIPIPILGLEPVQKSIDNFNKCLKQNEELLNEDPKKSFKFVLNVFDLSSIPNSLKFVIRFSTKSNPLSKLSFVLKSPTL